MNDILREMTDYRTDALKTYLQAWMDDEFRAEMDVQKDESAYIALASAGFLERFDVAVDLSKVLDIEMAREMILEASAFALKLDLRSMAEILLEDEDDDTLDDLQDVLWEREQMECFLCIASKLGKPIVDGGDSELLTSLARVGSAALDFDELLDVEHSDTASKLAESMDWYRNALPEVPGSSRSWWFHKHHERPMGRIIRFRPLQEREDKAASAGRVLAGSLVGVAGALLAIKGVAASDGTYSPHSTHVGQFNTAEISISVLKGKTGDLVAQVTGPDGEPVEALEGSDCRLMKRRREVARFKIVNGFGSCSYKGDFDYLELILPV